jgi:hypothetical protein
MSSLSLIIGLLYNDRTYITEITFVSRIYKKLVYAGVLSPDETTSKSEMYTIVRYHSGGSMKLIARILHLAYMVYL